jgi:tetratricopeptide (TPR) repeat protein
VADPVEVRQRLHQSVVDARALRIAGDYPAAAGHLRSAMAEAEDVLGADAVDLVAALNELGMVGKYAGTFAEADQVYHRALRICGAHGIVDGPNGAAILHNLGGLAHARGDARSAEAWAREGIAIRSRLPHADPAGLLRDRAALAAILIDLGQLDEARAILADVLRLGLAAASSHDREVAVALHNLGSAQFREGRFAEAAGTLRRAYDIKRALLGRRHPDLAITLYNLARCQLQLGRHMSARHNLRRAARLLTGVVPDNHPTLAACRGTLGRPSGTGEST